MKEPEKPADAEAAEGETAEGAVASDGDKPAAGVEGDKKESEEKKVSEEKK
jgi:large subunit ribosomal protein L25